MWRSRNGLVLAIICLAACVDRETPQAMQRNIYIPIVAKGWQPPNPKRGLATHHPDYCGDSGLLRAAWQYNWRPDINDCAGTDDIPMLYCWQDVLAVEQGLAHLGGDSIWLMGPNEPDVKGQCNMSSWALAFWWPRVEALARGRKLVSPAVVNPAWLVSFRAEYVGMWGHAPTLDALAIHCYEPGTSECKGLATEAIELARAWGSEVWVTEFSFFGGADAEHDAQEFIAWMNEEPMITHYSWFPTRLNGLEYWHPDAGWLAQTLVTWDGELTHWGEMYRWP